MDVFEAIGWFFVAVECVIIAIFARVWWVNRPPKGRSD